jgi:ADP-ribose pyrophosphatase
VYEKTIRAERAFEGRLVKVDVLDVELASGQRARREIVRHPGAVVVLAELPDGRFVFVRQFRKALEQELLEAVAGTLEPGEHPDACAARELEEETGYGVERLSRLGAIYPAPGYSEEVLHAYHARLRAAPGSSRPDADEKLAVVHLSAGEVEAMIQAGGMADSKTLAVWLLGRSRAERRGAAE